MKILPKLTASFGVPGKLIEVRTFKSTSYQVKTVKISCVFFPFFQDTALFIVKFGRLINSWYNLVGDKLPLGPPALMMSPQPVNLGMVKPALVQKRDGKYNISTDEAIKTTRLEINEPEWINPQADYWKQHGKCFAIDVEPVEMKRMAPFP